MLLKLYSVLRRPGKKKLLFYNYQIKCTNFLFTPNGSKINTNTKFEKFIRHDKNSTIKNVPFIFFSKLSYCLNNQYLFNLVFLSNTLKTSVKKLIENKFFLFRNIFIESLKLLRMQQYFFKIY